MGKIINKDKDDPVAIVDEDKLSVLVASIISTLVMAVGFLREVDLLVLAVRVAMTFTVSWVVTFLLILLVRRTARLELPEYSEEQELDEEDEDAIEGESLETEEEEFAEVPEDGPVEEAEEDQGEIE